MNDGNHNHDAASAPSLGSPPRGGSMTMADIHYRKSALEHAVRFVGAGQPRNVVTAAAAFETYLRNGDTIPYTVGPLTSAAFLAASIDNLSDMQAVLNAIERALADTAAEFRAHGADSAVDDELPDAAIEVAPGRPGTVA